MSATPRSSSTTRYVSLTELALTASTSRSRCGTRCRTSGTCSPGCFPRRTMRSLASDPGSTSGSAESLGRIRRIRLLEDAGVQQHDGGDRVAVDIGERRARPVRLCPAALADADDLTFDRVRLTDEDRTVDEAYLEIEEQAERRRADG